MSRPKVYICGPMRGYKDFNFPAFDTARDKFLGAGFDVVSPADMDRANEGAGIEQATHVYAKRDLAEILGLVADHDGLVLLPDWHRSTGAKAEVAVALWLKLKFWDAVTGDPIYPVISGSHY